MANPLAIELADVEDAGAGSASGASVDIGELRSCARLTLDVTAASGTEPSLVVTVETSPSGASWRAVGAFDAAGGATHQARTFAGLERFVRVSWAVSGDDDPEFTFTVTGQAHVIYAGPEDVERYSLTAGALEDVPDHVVADALLRATGKAESFIAAAFSMPLVSWDDSVRGAVADLAGYYVLKGRGFSGEDSDEVIVQAKDDAMAWLNKVARGAVKPPGVIDQTPDVYEGGAVMVSRPMRGWGQL